MDVKTRIVLPDGVLNVLNSVYNSKRRHYHTANHINRMLDSFREIAQRSNTITLEVWNWDVFQAAILFHDIVMFEDNCEEKSAEVAKILMEKQYLHYGKSIEDLDTLERLIIATDYRNIVVENFDEKLIRDLDLEGLADPWEKYVESRELIKKEFSYPSYSYVEFVEGRKKFLQHMLEFPEIYSTKYFKHLEGKARENMQKELDSYTEEK